MGLGVSERMGLGVSERMGLGVSERMGLGVSERMGRLWRIMNLSKIYGVRRQGISIGSALCLCQLSRPAGGSENKKDQKRVPHPKPSSAGHSEVRTTTPSPPPSCTPHHPTLHPPCHHPHPHRPWASCSYTCGFFQAPVPGNWRFHPNLWWKSAAGRGRAGWGGEGRGGEG
jgi:hypothetical protein